MNNTVRARYITCSGSSILDNSYSVISRYSISVAGMEIKSLKRKAVRILGGGGVCLGGYLLREGVSPLGVSA